MNSFLVSLFGSRTANQLSSPSRVVKSKSSEPIVAYRLWQLRDGDLYSVTVVHARWPRFVPMRMNEASLGIHAAKDLGGLVSEGYNFDVAGSVYLWGKVSEYEDGYTAEFAYPKTLFLPSKTDPVKVMELEDNYGVPCQFRDEFFLVPRRPPATAFIPYASQAQASAVIQQAMATRRVGLLNALGGQAIGWYKP